MRIESSVTSVSWIPSAAITGATKIPFGRENTVLEAAAETPLERRLSLAIMHGGPPPRPATIKAGGTILAEGDTADDIVLVLDGLVEVVQAVTWRSRLTRLTLGFRLP